MRIGTRLSLVWTFAGLLVFGGYGVWLVQRERADLMRSVERETWLLGTSVQVAVENALRDGQFDDVDETASRLEGVDASVDVAVFHRDGRLLLATGEGALGHELPADERPVLRYDPPRRPDRLLMITALSESATERTGTLVLARPLDDVRRDLDATTGTIALTVGLFALCSGLVGWGVGQLYVGRPLAALAQSMHEVGEGNLRPVLPETRDDEVGEVARAFDAMMHELAQTRQRLDEAAEARRQLVWALQEAERTARLGQLAATVAHEIGSPLQVLEGRARALLRTPDDPRRVARHAEILVRETERITRTVHQLLEITRPRAAEPGPVDLDLLVRRTVDLFELEAERTGIRWEIRSGELPPVFGHADRLQQVLVNLVGNALAASPPGGRITIGLRSESGRVALEVSDQGHGMAPEQRDRAFDPFYTTRAEQGGTGLGLAIVKRIVDDHGGQVDLISAPGEGTTVTMWLPQGEELS